MIQHWLLENPWPLSIGLGAFGFMQIRRGLIIRRKPPLGVGAAACIAAIAIAVIGWQVETPAEQVDRALDELARAGLRRDTDAIAKRIADRFNQDGVNKAGLIERIRREFVNYAPDSLSINGRDFHQQGETVLVDFVAVTSGRYQQIAVARYPIRARATFEKSAEGWQVTRLQRFDPLGNTGREIPLFSR